MPQERISAQILKRQEALAPVALSGKEAIRLESSELHGHLIDYEKFMELLDTDNYDHVKRDHQGWAAEFLSNGNGRDDKWTKSIAVCSRDFVDKEKSKLGVLAKGKDVAETNDGYQLREPTNSYMHHFQAQKGDIGPENTFFWNIND